MILYKTSNVAVFHFHIFTDVPCLTMVLVTVSTLLLLLPRVWWRSGRMTAGTVVITGGILATVILLCIIVVLCYCRLQVSYTLHLFTHSLRSRITNTKWFLKVLNFLFFLYLWNVSSSCRIYFTIQHTKSRPKCI